MNDAAEQIARSYSATRIVPHEYWHALNPSGITVVFGHRYICEEFIRKLSREERKSYRYINDNNGLRGMRFEKAIGFAPYDMKIYTAIVAGPQP